MITILNNTNDILTTTISTGYYCKQITKLKNEETSRIECITIITPDYKPNLLYS